MALRGPAVALLVPLTVGLAAAVVGDAAALAAATRLPALMAQLRGTTVCSDRAAVRPRSAGGGNGGGGALAAHPRLLELHGEPVAAHDETNKTFSRPESATKQYDENNNYNINCELRKVATHNALCMDVHCV